MGDSPDRRQFVALLAAAGGALAAGWPLLPDGAARVDAATSVFFAQPDGQRCLVRFFVSGVDAPAGRLRVFDDSHRLLATAGVIALGDGRLYGELWLTIGTGARIESQLEAPGLRGPLRTLHSLRPGPRWTIHWVTLLTPQTLQETLASLAPVPRAVEAEALKRLGAGVNPIPADIPLAVGDLPFLRLAEPALLVGQALGLPPATVAVVDDKGLSIPTLATVLKGSGVTLVVQPGAAAFGVSWRPGPDASRVLVVRLPAGSDPSSLGFPEGGARMAGLVEQWLLAAPQPPAPPAVAAGRAVTAAADEAQPVALIVGTAMEGLAQAAASVREWNARFLYPQIVAGQAETYFRTLQRRAGERLVPWTSGVGSPTPPPSATEANARAAARAAERADRAATMIACLAGALPHGGRGLDAIAGQLAFPVPGTLVFNPTPYPRSDLVQLTDASERVVTDVPPLGYAYFPLGRGDGAGWSAMPDDGRDHVLDTALFRVALDPESGSIRSLMSRPDGVEWVRSPGPGLNALDGARTEQITREALPGVAVRLVARRLSSHGGAVRSVITIYQQLAWVDIVNQADASGDEAQPYAFGFDLDPGGVEWEIPAGADRGTAPASFTHLRWIRLLGRRGTAMLAALDAAAARVDADGTLTSYAPAGPSRYRVSVRTPGEYAYPDDPWRFGWSAEPFSTAPVPGTGAATLPSFGSLLVVDQPGVVVVGMRPARDGHGVIVYLQELNGRPRVATLGAGLLAFNDARLVDLIERDLGPPAMTMVNGVGVELPAYGVAALRLLGTGLVGT